MVCVGVYVDVCGVFVGCVLVSNGGMSRYSSVVVV